MIDKGDYPESTRRTNLGMATSKAIWLVVISLGFYLCGALCIFGTSMLVGWAQRNYTKSKFVQAYPISGMVMKPWYPIYIRSVESSSGSMARLTLARKVATITLILWKKGERFDAERLKPQAA